MAEKYYEDSFGTLYIGDSKEILEEVQESIKAQMCMTSPPYWALRNYGVDGQLGQEESFKDFVSNLSNYFDFVGKALKDDGTLWVNLSDTFYGSGKGSGGKSKKQMSNRGSYFSPVNKGNKGSMLSNPFEFKKMKELPDKCMCLIPERFAIDMVDNHNWILRNDIIWHKPNAMVTSATDRFSLDYESLFMFAKQKDYLFNQQLEPYTTAMNIWGGDKLKATGVSKWDEGTGQASYRKRNLRPNPEGRNKRMVWSINTQPMKGMKHVAKYPENLCVTPILAGSNEGDIVLDPFFGSGTTAVVAERLNRKWIGIELNPQSCEEAIERILKARK